MYHSIRWVESGPVYVVRAERKIDNERHDCCCCGHHSIGVGNEAWFWIKHYPWQRTRSLCDCDDDDNNAQLVSSFTESDISRCKKAERTAGLVRRTEIEIIGGMCEAEHHTWFCLSSSLLAARITASCVCSTSSPIYTANTYLFKYTFIVVRADEISAFLCIRLIGNALIIFAVSN